MGADVVEHAKRAHFIAKEQEGKPKDPLRLHVAGRGKRGSKAHCHPTPREDALHLKVEIILRRVGDIRKGTGNLDGRTQGCALIQ